MPGWHGSAAQSAEPHDPVRDRRHSRIGLVLFAIYLAIYAIYVVVNAFWPTVMDAVPLAGVNLAILYGFGLIGGAIVLALIYGWLCRTRK